MTDHTTSDTTAAPVPPKRKLPLWGWILAAVVAVLLIVAIIAVVTGLNSDSNSDSSNEGASNEPSAVASATPTPSSASSKPSATPSSSATPSPADDGATSSEQSTGNVSLDDLFVIGQAQPAIWQLPSVDGWEITTIDQEGVSVQTNTELSCTFTTIQNRLTSDIADATSDRADTEGVVQNLQQGFVTQFTDAEITNTPGLAVPYGSIGIVEGDVEFAGFRADYVRADTGEEYSSMFVVRAMSQIDGAMYSVLNCPTETINADETIWRGMLDQNVVVAGD
ncbi:MAG TPA: hypothetical protein VGP24_01890 [Glaciihabitans sp.]|jgi:hypothetical protein|nr:hypothetical protein [Glaciihabitans sp.]